MNDVSPHYAFTKHSGLLESACRSSIRYIAEGFHPVHRRVGQDHSHELASRLGHEALAPVFARQNVADTRLETTGADLDHPDRLVAAAPRDDIWKCRPGVPPVQALPDEFAGRLTRLMGSPYEIARNGGILRIGFKDGLCILRLRTTQAQPRCLDCLRKLHGDIAAALWQLGVSAV